MIKNIIFDLDDTLIYSTKYFIQTNKETAKEMGIRVPTDAEVIAYGKSWEDFIQKTWPGISVDDFKKVYKGFADKISYQIIPGANESLEELSKSKDLYILSKRPIEALDLRLQQTGLKTGLFKRIFCNEDLKYKKPDPRTFNVALGETGCKREETLSVGDLVDDMTASLGAGLQFVAVLTGYTPKDDFLNNGLPKEHILDSVAYIPRYIKNL